jgi:hypothetical protein
MDGMDLCKFSNRGLTQALYFVSKSKPEKNKIRISGITKRQIQLWKQALIKTMVVWVDDAGDEPKAYWGMFPKILYKNRIALDARHQLELRPVHQIERLLAPRIARVKQPLISDLLATGLTKGLKSAARDFFGEWRKRPSTNNLLGPIEVTLRTWRKMTSQSHSVTQVEQSLRLLPVARAIIESKDCNSIQGYRELPLQKSKDGNLIARSYLILEREVQFSVRSPGIVVVVIEEVEKFPPVTPQTLFNPEFITVKYRFLNVYERLSQKQINPQNNKREAGLQ